MQLFHCKVCLINFFLCHIVNFVALVDSTSNTFLSWPEIAYNLGYDDLNAVTTEDMTMEVRKSKIFSRQIIFHWTKMTTHEIVSFALSENAGSQGNWKADKSKENDGRGSKTFLNEGAKFIHLCGVFQRVLSKYRQPTSAILSSLLNFMNPLHRFGA